MSANGKVSDPGPEVTPVAVVESALKDLTAAPLQGDEGAPDAWLAFDPDVIEALGGLRAGDEVILLSWLHQADRCIVQVHPRGDTSRPSEGVFSTRSPHRPNPIGLHTVEILEIDGDRVRVRNLEAIDGTPILDVKPALDSEVGRR